MSSKPTHGRRAADAGAQRDNFFEIISRMFGPFGVAKPNDFARDLIFRQVVGGHRANLGRGAAPQPTFKLTKESFNRLLTAYGVEARVEEPFVKRFLGQMGGGLTLPELRHRVDFFVKLVLWKYGSHLRAIRDLGSASDFDQVLAPIPFIELHHRNDVRDRMAQEPALDVEDLTLAERKSLGYTIAAAAAPDTVADAARKTAREKGLRNSESFLYSHHVNVYLAGSMREESDFLEFQRVGKELTEYMFKEHRIRLVVFDPTICWYASSADKGLLESLMLKKASIGVMIAGSKDTFGKDSEAAQLLGQGKPVIVYASKDEVATIFREIHPLRMQVSPETGVAHGITVVRTPGQCAEAASRLLLHELDVEVIYDFQPPAQLNDPDGSGSDEGSVIALVDRKADPANGHQSILRVVTNNPALTRAFWSRYFDQN